MWHAPSRIYYLIGIPALTYCVDFFVGFFIRNHLLEDVYFERYGEKGVAVSSFLDETWRLRPTPDLTYSLVYLS